LVRYDTYNVVRALLRRKRVRIPLENGAEVESREGRRSIGAVHLTGYEVFAILCGRQGRGKTLAACYAIAHKGGMYTRAPQWTRLHAIDVDEAIAAPVLVIDQFGREHFGQSEWSLSQFEDVLDTRFQSLSKLTLVVGNLKWEQFAERLQKTTVIDRVFGEGGVFVEFGGESIRPALREKALKGQP
jgi:DNA replication protein DnaC